MGTQIQFEGGGGGGGEACISWVKQTRGHDFYSRNICVSGVAASVWHENFTKY